MSELTDEMAIRQWQDIAIQVESTIQQTQDQESFVVQPGSLLAGDDTASDPYRVSHCARSGMNDGVDHMHALTTLILGVPIIHAASDYTLIRGALENLATAFWLLHPSDSRERIERALRWHAKNYFDGDKATAGLGLPNYVPLQANFDKVAEVGALAGCKRKRKGITDGYTSTEVLKYVDDNTSIEPRPHLMWQVCSGFAHGRQWASFAMNEAEITPTTEEGVMSVRFTSDFKRLLVCGFPAFQLMNEVVRLFADRARAEKSE
jgi:hypothetical protein